MRIFPCLLQCCYRPRPNYTQIPPSSSQQVKGPQDKVLQDAAQLIQASFYHNKHSSARHQLLMQPIKSQIHNTITKTQDGKFQFTVSFPTTGQQSTITINGTLLCCQRNNTWTLSLSHHDDKKSETSLLDEEPIPRFTGHRFWIEGSIERAEEQAMDDNPQKKEIQQTDNSPKTQQRQRTDSLSSTESSCSMTYTLTNSGYEADDDTKLVSRFISEIA